MKSGDEHTNVDRPRWDDANAETLTAAITKIAIETHKIIFVPFLQQLDDNRTIFLG
jgi:hypothetical protein